MNISSLGPFLKQFTRGYEYLAANSLVDGVVCIGVLDSHNDEDMLEMRSDVLRSERLGSWFLEYHSHYVIANMPLSQQLQKMQKI